MIFFLIAVSVLASIYGYIGWRIIMPAGFSTQWNVILWVVVILFLLMPPTSLLLRIYGYKSIWTDLFAWIAYLDLGFFMLLFTLLVIRDLALVATVGVSKSYDLVQKIMGPEIGPVGPADPNRRQLILNSLNLGILGVSGILAGYGIYEARRRPGIVKVAVPINNLPDDLEGFRIVQITDLHVGSTVKHNFVQTVVDQVNKLAPDLIVFTGDLADGTVPDLRSDVAPLSELSALHGAYFVTGNHEYYSGVEAWLVEIDRLGLDVLINEHRILRNGASSILLAGVTDYNAGQFLESHESNPEAAIDGAELNTVKILLAHQPRSIFAAARVGYDLQLSGHTHGGQLFPWNFLVGLQQPYIAGLHKYSNTWIYVSRGAGYWGPPLRVGIPSEITLITLTKSRHRVNTTYNRKIQKPIDG